MCLMTCDVGSCVLYNCVGWCLMIVDVAHDCYIYISLISLGLLGELFLIYYYPIRICKNQLKSSVSYMSIRSTRSKEATGSSLLALSGCHERADR